MFVVCYNKWMTDLVDSFFTDLNRQVGWPEGSISWLVLNLGYTLEWPRELPANTSAQADARDFNPASLEWGLNVGPSENLPGSRMRGARIKNGCSGPSSHSGKSLPPLERCLCHMRWAVAELCAGARGLAPTVWWPFGLFSEESDLPMQLFGASRAKPLIDWVPSCWVQMLLAGAVAVSLRCWQRNRAKNEMEGAATLFAKTPRRQITKGNLYKGQRKVEHPGAL